MVKGEELKRLLIDQQAVPIHNVAHLIALADELREEHPSIGDPDTWPLTGAVTTGGNPLSGNTRVDHGVLCAPGVVQVADFEFHGDWCIGRERQPRLPGLETERAPHPGALVPTEGGSGGSPSVRRLNPL